MPAFCLKPYRDVISEEVVKLVGDQFKRGDALNDVKKQEVLKILEDRSIYEQLYKMKVDEAELEVIND